MKRKIFLTFLESIPPGARVLDAGCGDGNWGRMMKNIRPDLKLTGMDLSLAGNSNSRYYDKMVTGDLLNLKMPAKGKFGAIFCSHVIEHIEPGKLDLIAENFRSVLDRGGVIILETPHPVTKYVPKFLGYNFYNDPSHRKPYRPKELKTLFESHGFETIETAFQQAIFGSLETGKLSMPKKILYALGIAKTSSVYFGRKK